MKKAQILSAIALAFALGVVAPVAGVYNTSNTYAAEARTTATRAEVEAAVQAVESNSAYNKIATYLNTVAAIDEKAADGEFDKSDVADAIATLKSALTTGTPAFAVLAETGVNPSNQTIIDAAKKTTYYNIYADIYSAVENEDLAALKSALGAYNTAAAKENSGLKAVEISGLNADGATVNSFTLDNLTQNPWYKALFDDVESAQNTLNSYNNAISSLTSALKAILKDQSLLDGVDTIDGLEALATNDNIEGFNNWKAVYDAVAKVEPTDKVSTGNWDKVKAIATAYKTATGNYTDTVEQIAEALMSYEGTQQPTDPDTKPGDDSNKDDNKTPTTPGTGIVSTAEGSASTTISIVAGLATALTALGAGVVAYRNARRSSEK